VRCVSGRGDCRDGFSCVHLGGIEFYCLQDPEPPPATCATLGAPRSAPRSALGVVLGALVALFGRRRRR
jgi:MYXO-CTERM domain-containing protein